MAEEPQQDTQKVRRMLEQQAERESLSFQSLVQEYGDFTVPPGPSDDVGNMKTLLDAPTNIVANNSVADGSLLDRDSLFLGGTVMGDLSPEAARKKREDDMRVLTASGGKRTPIWLQAFFIGGLSLLLLMPIVGGSGFVMFQPWYSYVVMFLAAVTAFWAVYGMVREEESKERWLCLIGLGMALAATTVAWLTRAPPMHY
jgi:cation transport ATPase